MNHWTQTHILLGYAGMLGIDAVLLTFLAYAIKRIKQEEAGH